MSTDQAMIVRNADVQALVGSKYYVTRKNGIEFATGEDGELLPIPKADISELVGTLDRFNQAWGWWVGDTGCVIEALFGEADLVKFWQQIHFDPDQGKKYMSVSRTYGWPSRIAELRHPDPQVSHRHHQLAAGFKDLKQRMDLLNTASKKKMNSADFYDLVQQKKAGPGAAMPTDDGDGGTEYGVFRPQFRAYDPKTDNPDQYLQEFTNHVKERDFPAYLDPAVAAKFKAEEARIKAVAEIPEPRRTELLTQAAEGTLSEQGFKDAVKEEKAKSTAGDKIAKFARKAISDKVIADETEREKQITALIEQATTEGDTLGTFKDRITNFKKTQKDRAGALKTIETMAAKVTDETKRQELIDKAHAEGLTVEAFEPIVKGVLTDQFVQEESERIKKESDEKLKNVTDPGKIAEKVDKAFAKGKTAKPKAASSGLAMQKGGRAKKSAAKKGKKK